MFAMQDNWYFIPVTTLLLLLPSLFFFFMELKASFSPGHFKAVLAIHRILTENSPSEENMAK